MAKLATVPVRKAILTLLKADATLTAIVPASRIYPQSPPASHAWPFVRYGAPTAIPIVATRIDGSELSVAVHGFAKDRIVDGVLVETAEDHADRIGAAIAAALDRKMVTITTPYPARIRIRSTGCQLIADGGEADAYHAVQNFRVRVIG
ncbi:hypothetical protein CLG96_00150 [Sphingomonas oleivorans]|uniref:DUF3168 domain-containing protein n=1 Tax=Sphingomonas oleivorans TaxID=1735121 RepID=A0A2T5G3D2_9SPHN|nr:DUF3168 domain-containing protein [Sphingomonas oleivorans]PTQ13732.1 hypothetical protein CLG96_00150 [Sphingomonas oleivorans]